MHIDAGWELVSVSYGLFVVVAALIGRWCFDISSLVLVAWLLPHLTHFG